MSEASAIATNHAVSTNGRPGKGVRESKTAGRRAKKEAMTWTRTQQVKKKSHWTERTNFLADSPYFRTFVQKEMYGLDSASESLRDLAMKVDAFKKQGAVMCEVTSSLALACQMRREEADKVKIKEQEMMKNVEGRRHALGKDVSSALENLGKVLGEMAMAQQSMIEIFDKTFTVALTGFADGDLKGVNMLRQEAANQTEAADDLMYKYLTGKQTMYDESSRRTTSTDSSLSFGGVWGKLRSSSTHSNQDEEESRIEELEAAKALAAANWRTDLEEIRLNKVTAELKRFQFLKLLVDVKNRRDSELAEGTLSAALGIKACFVQSQDTINGVLPVLSRIADRYVSKRKSFYTHDIPLWQQREKCIVKVLSKCQTSSSNANHAVRAVANGHKEAIKHQVTQLDRIERKLRVWEMPTILANCCQYKRETPPGVLYEGWLYQKNSSRLSMHSWLKRWFILKKDGIFCLDLNPDQKKERTEDSISKVKICDVVLSTVRNVRDDVTGRFQFELIVSGQKPLFLRAEGPHQKKEWLDGLKSAVETCLVAGDAHSDTLNQDIGKQDRRSTEIRVTVLQSKGPVMQELENLMEVMEEEGEEEEEEEEVGEKTCLSKIFAMNKYCADCGEPSPDWVSLNLGILVCLECSGVHRSLGVHVSKVRSLRLDSLSTVESNLLLSLGNDRMNEIWEECLEDADALSHSADRKTRENWIRGKYIGKKYIKKENDFADVEVQSKKLYDAASTADVLGMVNALAKGAKIDWKNPAENGRSALHASVLAKVPEGASDELTIEGVELLIQNGAKFNYADNDGDNVIECSLIHDGDPKMVDYLTMRSEQTSS